MVIKLSLNLDAFVLNVIFSTIFIAPAMWFSGRVVVGGKKAKLVDAILIAVIGTVVGSVFGTFFSGVIAVIIQLII
jgi:hypothetical protein